MLSAETRNSRNGGIATKTSVTESVEPFLFGFDEILFDTKVNLTVLTIELIKILGKCLVVLSLGIGEERIDFLQLEIRLISNDRAQTEHRSTVCLAISVE